MKKSFIALGTILFFATAVSAQSSLSKTLPPVTKEKDGSVVKTDKAITTAAPVKVEKIADEPISAFANEKSKAVSDVILENEVAPVKVERPAAPVKVATAEKPAVKAKTAKTKN